MVTRVPVTCRSVPRSMDLTAESPHPLARIRFAFQSEVYWQDRLRAFEGASPTLDSLTTDSAGRTTVSMTMRFGGDQLPDPLRRLRLAGLDIVQRERWFADEDGGLRGEIGVDALRTPISGHGAVLLTAVPPGTRLAGTATVEVGVPLIGGTIARFITGLLANGIVDIVRITDAWLDEN
ncbi:hypothetical protein TUM20983_28730 [Mycobacterium antarcticum]|nr:hypothetical protein TUM20983_28730 [Mycolicibacterium sp. TUM20983]